MTSLVVRVQYGPLVITPLFYMFIILIFMRIESKNSNYHFYSFKIINLGAGFSLQKHTLDYV